MKIFTIFFFILALSSHADERPNILWITSEDNAAHWLGCYGNAQAQTPRLDALAEKGTRFTAAFSNSPVCAVARSSILMGRYAPAMGTQHMRSRHAIPEGLNTYVHHLRKAGYYCTNNSKTDYNIAGADGRHWDENSNKAHYKNRPANTPFFAIFNLTISHESNLFPPKVQANRKSKKIPQTPRLSPSEIKLPPYLPDLPEVRSDWAIYYDTMTALDREVGRILDELEEAELAENTLIFYYGDHGGPTPRGKRYLHDTGVRIPMIVHLPEKWKHLSPFIAGQPSDEIVTFVDLAPTLLSLAGLDPDPQMQGRPFLGKNRLTPPKGHYAFLFADRFDEIYGMRRGLSDGRFKYIRHFTPHLWTAPYSFYQFQMPSWTAWQKAWKENRLSPLHAALWESNQTNEELFDTQADPWEIKNLAQDPAHAERLAEMRQALRQKMIAIHDTALVPEPLFQELASDQPIATIVAQPDFPHQTLVDLAFLASAQDPKNLPALRESAQSDHPAIRYWGLSGITSLAHHEESRSTKDQLEKSLADPVAINGALAAHALFLLGDQEKALAALTEQLENEALPRHDQAWIVNTFMQLRQTQAIPASWIKRALNSPNGDPRLGTLAENLKKL